MFSPLLTASRSSCCSVGPSTCSQAWQRRWLKGAPPQSGSLGFFFFLRFTGTLLLPGTHSLNNFHFQSAPKCLKKKKRLDSLLDSIRAAVRIGETAASALARRPAAVCCGCRVFSLSDKTISRRLESARLCRLLTDVSWTDGEKKKKKA